MRKRTFGKFKDIGYQMGGSVDSVDEPIIPEPLPPIAGSPMPNAGMKNKTMGEVAAPRTTPSPKAYSQQVAAKKRMRQFPASPALGPMTGGLKSAGMPQAQQGPMGPGGQQPPAPEDLGDRWMGEIWQQLTPPPLAPSGGIQGLGYAAGGSVDDLMSIYNQTMSDLEGGGIGYANGESVRRENPVERGRRLRRERDEAPTRRELSKAFRQKWERENPHRLFPEHLYGTTIDSEDWGSHGADWNAADMLDPTRMPDPGYAHGGAVDQSREIASMGRGGDSMLMHINPAELGGLQSLLGPVSVNPDTGNPEAAPWLIPLMGLAAGATAAGAASDWEAGPMVMGALAGMTLGGGLGALGGAPATSLMSTTAIPSGGALAGVPGLAWGPATGGLANVAVGGAGTAAPGAVTAAQLAGPPTLADKAPQIAEQGLSMLQEPQQRPSRAPGLSLDPPAQARTPQLPGARSPVRPPRGKRRPGRIGNVLA